jgi:hypothetical protein
MPPKKLEALYPSKVRFQRFYNQCWVVLYLYEEPPVPVFRTILVFILFPDINEIQFWVRFFKK